MGEPKRGYQEFLESLTKRHEERLNSRRVETEKDIEKFRNSVDDFKCIVDSCREGINSRKIEIEAGNENKCEANPSARETVERVEKLIEEKGQIRVSDEIFLESMLKEGKYEASEFKNVETILADQELILGASGIVNVLRNVPLSENELSDDLERLDQISLELKKIRPLFSH